MATPIRFSQREDFGVLLGVTHSGASVLIGPDPLIQCRELGLYVVFSDTAMGGSVVIETAPSMGHAGTWAPLAQVDWVGPGVVHYVSLVGAHLAMRVRVDHAIVNGAVDVFAIGS
jgi:hypothetical protein